MERDVSWHSSSSLRRVRDLVTMSSRALQGPEAKVIFEIEHTVK